LASNPEQSQEEQQDIDPVKRRIHPARPDKWIEAKPGEQTEKEREQRSEDDQRPDIMTGADPAQPIAVKQVSGRGHVNDAVPSDRDAMPRAGEDQNRPGKNEKDSAHNKRPVLSLPKPPSKTLKMH
jgi:hypothetical protein